MQHVLASLIFDGKSSISNLKKKSIHWFLRIVGNSMSALMENTLFASAQNAIIVMESLFQSPSKHLSGTWQSNTYTPT